MYTKHSEGWDRVEERGGANRKGGPYFSDWNPDFTEWAGKYWTIYGMEKGTCHGIVNALDYIKDENNDLLDILFDHIVFI